MSTFWWFQCDLLPPPTAVCNKSYGKSQCIYSWRTEWMFAADSCIARRTVRKSATQCLSAHGSSVQLSRLRDTGQPARGRPWPLWQLSTTQLQTFQSACPLLPCLSGVWWRFLKRELERRLSWHTEPKGRYATFVCRRCPVPKRVLIVLGFEKNNLINILWFASVVRRGK
jgi:hypothetical protein